MKIFAKISNGFLFLLVLGAILLLSDLSNRKKKNPSEGNNFRLAFVHWIHAPITEQLEEGIYKGLSDAGLTEEENLTINRYNACGDISMLNSILKQVQSQQPDLLFVSCTPALQSAIQTIKKIPVLFTAVADPVLAGAGKDETHHLENVTGCNVVCDFETMCRLITENVPRIKTLGSLYCPGEIISVQFKEDFSETASRYGLEVQFFPANNASELPDAVLSMTNTNIDAVCQMGDNLMSSGISTLIKGVVSANLPYFDFNPRPPGTKMESLIQLDVDYFQNGYNAALLAAEVLLKGKSPGEIPFQKPLQTIIEINPVKAEKFGIHFNEKLKREAKVVIGEKEPFKSSVRIAMVHYISSPDCEDVTSGILKRFAELGHHPEARAIGTLYNPGEMASVSSLKELEATCEKNKLALVAVPVHSVSEGTDATTLLYTKNIDAICQLPDTYTIPGFSSMVKITRKLKIPLFCFITSQVEMGAIAAIAGDFV